MLMVGTATAPRWLACLILFAIDATAPLQKLQPPHR
jgi:hypothetical protein